MCHSLLTDEAADYLDYSFGDIFSVCEDEKAAEHIAVRLLKINRRYLPKKDEKAAIKGVIEAFAQSARFVVAEYNYFDIDYRSEYSRTHESSFKLRSPEVFRLHFFAPTSEPPRSYRLSDFVQQHQKTYLGYMIFRPQVPGFVGRSLITTSVTHPDLASDLTFDHHVRTAVREYVQLFGVGLHADGVAFMEQDGHLLRCAHVSSWICHYSAVLRGLVNRHTTADFHGLDDDGYAPYGRLYPSLGLSVNVLSATLRRVGLPPEVIDITTLRETRDRQWYDSPTKWPAENTVGELEFWVEKNLTETLCRYLNSGVPCILSRHSMSHTQVVVGYLRKEDLKSPNIEEVAKPLASNEVRGLHSDVTHLIVSDDQEGPYVLLDLKVLIDEIVTKQTTAIVVPLPRSLLLSGGVAEGYAGLLLARYGIAHLDMVNADSEEESPERLAAAADFVKNTSTGSGLAIRSYATTGTDFKESWAERLKDQGENDEVIRLVAHLPLPKFVWVSEATDRERRTKGELDVVRATAVFDAFEVVLDADSQSQILPLFIHLPGRAYVPPPVDWADFSEPEGDAETAASHRGEPARLTAELAASANDRDADEVAIYEDLTVRTSHLPYRSGRHKRGNDTYFSAERYAERSKGAAARLW